MVYLVSLWHQGKFTILPNEDSLTDALAAILCCLDYVEEHGSYPPWIGYLSTDH